MSDVSLYSEKDFVEIVDEDGRPLPAVPKAWIKADMLPPGAKPKSGRRSAASKSDDSSEGTQTSSGESK